ncbi:unnamed protein product [Closterium sp. NIES-54]
MKDADHSSGKGRGDGEASCFMVGVVEPTVLLAPEAGEDFKADTAAVQANPMVVLLDSGCSHHLMGTKEAFVEMKPGGDIKHVRGFNGALQSVEGRCIVALRGENGKQILVPDVLYLPGVHTNLLSAGQLKDSEVKLQDVGDQKLLVSAARDVLGQAKYTDLVLCIDLRPCLQKLMSAPAGVVALRTIASATKSMSDMWHARLVHVDVDTIKSSAKHEVAVDLDIKHSTAADLPCAFCVGGKLARHTFPDQGLDAENALDVVHIDLYGPFRVAANDGSIYFLLLKDRKTCYVWVRPIAKKSDSLVVFEKWLKLQRGKKLVPKAWWGLHLGVSPESKGWEVLDLTDNTVVTTVEAIFYETMSLEAWKEEHGPISAWKPANVPTDPSSTTTPLLAVEDDDVEDVTPPSVPTSTSPLPLVVDLPKTASPTAIGDEGSIAASPLAPVSGIAVGRRGEMHLGGRVQKPSTTGEHRAEDSAKMRLVKELTAEEMSAREQSELAEEPSTEDQLDDCEPSDVLEVLGGVEGELSSGEQSDNNDVVEVSVEDVKTRCSSCPNPEKPAEKLSYHACLPSTAYNTLLDDAEDDVDQLELDPDMHAKMEHRWDIAMMTVKEALASWKVKAVKAAMDEEIKSLITNGTWELVERPRCVNIMKNCWVLMMKYHVDDTVVRERACLVMKGFTQVYGTEYDKTYALVGSYVTLRIFLSIVAVLDLHLMQLDMKNAFLQSKLDRVLYMYQPDYYNDGTGHIYKLLKNLYGLNYYGFTIKFSSTSCVGVSSTRSRPVAQRGGVLTEGQLVAVCGDDDEAGHCLQVQQAGEWPDSAKRQPLADRCLHYMANTRDAALEFGGGPESLCLVGNVDADDTGDKQNRMSTAGYVFVFGGAALSWSSQRIKCATLSSIESEYVAATEAGKETRYLRFLLPEFWLLDDGKPTVLHVQSERARGSKATSSTWSDATLGCSIW